MMSAENGLAHLEMADLIEIAAGARGKELQLEVNDWAGMFRVAHEHKFVPLLACSLLYSTISSRQTKA